MEGIMNDLEIIRQLEKLLSINLEIREKSVGMPVGYTLNLNNHVEDISLTQIPLSKVTEVGKLLSFLDELRYLRITYSGLVDLSAFSSLDKLLVLSVPQNKIHNLSALKNMKGLIALNLSHNSLVDISVLEGITNLRELYLADNNIKDISPLEKNHKLEALVLRNNRVKNIFSLKRLKKILRLDLAYNAIKDIQPLSKLINLIDLNLSDNKISEIKFLGGITKLETLNLNKNSILDISPLGNIACLKNLYLSTNLLTDIAPLNELKNLENLHLNNNQISSFPLFNLINLRNLELNSTGLKSIDGFEIFIDLVNLNLATNSLSDISALSSLANLEVLNLSNNIVVDFSPLKALEKMNKLNIGFNKINNINFLSSLNKIENLNLIGNQITDISPLASLSFLKVLNISQNQISDISILSNLTQLSHLYMSNNMVSDITPLSNLIDLEKLRVSGNRLSDITSISNLKKINTLNLSHNQITDIEVVKEMKDLIELNLRDNPLRELKEWICDFDMEISWTEYSKKGQITLFDNPLRIPPSEIVRQGKRSVRNFFDQLLEQKEDYLFEAKMLIVGEPGAGKTSLARKIENLDSSLPDIEQTTRGIDVRQYYFNLAGEDWDLFKDIKENKSRSFRLNLWDFGGQEIYKATHRFFLSKRSLYALVADTRNEDTDFNYWLHIVEMFGGDSPLLIILNEKHQRRRNLDVAAMRQRFKNITQVVDVDFAEEDKTRLGKLLMAVRYFALQLPHVGSPVPAKWKNVRDALENDKRNTITLQDYLSICSSNSIIRTEDALVLSQYFHDIGVFLHFQDDPLLMKTIFLKPNWATNAVYKILDHNLLNAKDGQFDKNDAKLIWYEDEFDGLRDELLHLMGKFFLSYEIDNSGKFIVPERLPSMSPEYSWEEGNHLLLRYSYDIFMPKGIMSQFIVQMHRYIRNQRLVWKRGVILERDSAFAEVIESYDARMVGIKISGENCRDFMTIITERFDAIHQQYSKMLVEKLIPCNCNECKQEASPYFYFYRDLKRRMEKGRHEVECGKSYRMVNVRSLIDDVLDDFSVANNKREHITSINRNRTKIFISYSHKDRDWLSRVQVHLKVLEKLGVTLDIWDDTRIKAGLVWRNEIAEALTEAKVAVLLVSTDFLASDFINNDELPPLLNAAENEGAVIIPLILKPSLFTNHPHLARFQSVNDPSEPLVSLNVSEQEEALVTLTKRIFEIMA